MMNGSQPQKLPCLFLLFFALVNATYANLGEDDTVVLFKIAELKSGLKLHYTLSLPRPFSMNKSYPLVVALHYGGKVTPFFAKDFMISFVEPALKDLEAILVAPDCPSEGWTNTISEAAILELIFLLMEEYNIDSNCLALLGYSLGGSGTWYMAARHPDIFPVAIPISAPADPLTTPVVKDIPLLIIHGELDDVYPLHEVKNLYKRQIKYVKETKMVVVDKAGHHDLLRFIPSLKTSIPWIKKMWEER